MFESGSSIQMFETGGKASKPSALMTRFVHSQAKLNSSKLRQFKSLYSKFQIFKRLYLSPWHGLSSFVLRSQNTYALPACGVACAFSDSFENDWKYSKVSDTDWVRSIQTQVLFENTGMWGGLKLIQIFERFKVSDPGLKHFR